MGQEVNTWRKSSFCSSQACVEVADGADAILVRDSKNSMLTFDLTEWAAFVTEVRTGSFDFR